MMLTRARMLLLTLLWFDAVLSFDPQEEWKQLERMLGQWSHKPFYGRSAKKSIERPDSQRVGADEHNIELFKSNSSSRTLPTEIREMLQMTAPPPTTAPARTDIEILCNLEKLFVRIKKALFKQSVTQDLKVGKCNVSHENPEHYFFLYSIDADCGVVKEFNRDDIRYRNALLYSPSGVIIRDVPLDIELECICPRYFWSYRAGFYPSVRGRTLQKMLRTNSLFVLTPQDELGFDSDVFTMGWLMQFEARISSPITGSEPKRLYVNKCFMTASSDYSTPNYTIIDNYGCMTDSKVSPQSKFLPRNSKTSQKFVLTAFLFNEAGTLPSGRQQLYMHCELSIGGLVPSQGAKACTYDSNTKMWREVSGLNSVCTCCETTCSPTPSTTSGETDSTWTVSDSSTNFKIK